MALNVKTRWGAFGIHLAISILILLVLLAIIFFIWFPYDLIYAGGIDGLKILVGVDIILGPLLTLIVYNPAKKELKWDLTIIGLLQLGCLGAGLWLVFNERPLVQVLADDGIHLLAASDFKHYEMTPSDLPGANPKFVMLDLPEDRAQIGSIKFTSEFVEEKPFAFRTDLYLPMANLDRKSFDQRIKFIQEFMVETDLENLNKLKVENCSWVDIHSKHIIGHACVDYQRGITQLSKLDD